MKRALLISFFVSIFCFGIVTYLTGTYDALVDGRDIVGWPINFYDKCGDCYSDNNNFNFLFFLIDYAIIFAVIFIIVNLTKKLMKT